MEANVKNGFVLGHQVSVCFLAEGSSNSLIKYQAETFSGQAMINEELQSTDTLSKLEELMNEIFVRRADHIPSIALVL